MPDIAQKPGNPLSAMRFAATKLLLAYRISQPPSSDPVKAETLILEAIELAKWAIELLRRGK
jgi:hypothetical protein